MDNPQIGPNQGPQTAAKLVRTGGEGVWRQAVRKAMELVCRVGSWLDLWYNAVEMSDLDRIGLVAVRQETLPLLEAFQVREQDRCGAAILHVGQLCARPVVLVEVLPGTVNAALGAQALILRHSVTLALFRVRRRAGSQACTR